MEVDFCIYLGERQVTIYAMEKKQTLTEHNALIRAHYDMSAPEQDIFSLVLAQLRKEDASDQLYRVSIKAIEELATKQINYQTAEKTAKKLLSRVCTIIRDNGDPLYVAMISDAEHIRGAGYLEIGISPKLRPYLVDLKNNFTRYQFRIFGALRSKYSKRIYKMLSQFKSTGVMRISVEELKKRLKLLDPKTGKEIFSKDWTTFVKKVLEVAKREINEFSDLRYTYEAKKTGRKFTSLEFKIACVPLEQLKVKHGESQGMEDLHQRLVSYFKLSDWQATDIIVHVPEQEIRKTLHEIQLQVINHRIQNMGGYTAKLFDSKYNLGFFERTDSLPAHGSSQLGIGKRSVSSTRRAGATSSIGELMGKVAKAS